jgi:hypothetical protein
MVSREEFEFGGWTINAGVGAIEAKNWLLLRRIAS